MAKHGEAEASEDPMFKMAPSIWMLEHMLQDFQLDDDLVQGVLTTLNETCIIDTKDLPPKLHLWLLLRAVRHKVSKNVIDTTVLGMLSQIEPTAEKAKLEPPALKRVAPDEKLMTHVKAQAILEHIRPGGDIEKFRLLAKKLLPSSKHCKAGEKALRTALIEVLDNGSDAERLLKTYPMKPVLHSLAKYVEDAAAVLKPTFLERIERMIKERNVRAWQELGKVARGPPEPNQPRTIEARPSVPPSPIPSPRRKFEKAGTTTMVMSLDDIVQSKKRRLQEKEKMEATGQESTKRDAALNLEELKRRRKALEEAGGDDPLEGFLKKGDSKPQSLMGEQKGAQAKTWGDKEDEAKRCTNLSSGGDQRQEVTEAKPAEKEKSRDPTGRMESDAGKLTTKEAQSHSKGTHEVVSHATQDSNKAKAPSKSTEVDGIASTQPSQKMQDTAKTMTIPEKTDEVEPLNPDGPRKSKQKKRKPVWKSEETEALIRLIKTLGFDHEKLYKAEQALFQKYNRDPTDIKFKIRSLKQHNIL
uniref:Uncharacterized protein n=1 Tax=Picocystis salinarum TaxID=88271 RepID=A0A6U9R3G9_9CHLO